MKKITKYSIPEHTQKLLEARRYKDCITLLRRHLTENPLPGALNRLSQAESTYRYLLEYFTHGLVDPGRDDMLAGIRLELGLIAQKLDMEEKTTDSPDIFFSILRMCRLRPSKIDDCISRLSELKAIADLALASGQYPTEIMTQIEEQEEKLFNILWTADSLTKNDYKKIVDAIKESIIPFTSSALCIAATGLYLMNYYSGDAMRMLCELSSDPDFKISARALSTLILALSRWRSLASDDRILIKELSVLTDVEGLSSKIRTVVKTAVRTRDTDRISRKMQREVIPGLMQFGPDIIKKLKKSSEEASFSDLEGNPEWEEILRKSGLEDKLRELTEMQSDGADVMMVAFSNLKGFPFFRYVRNWMLPFTIQHPMLKQLHLIDNASITSMLEMSGLMCDSDKYSFAFSLASMPEAQRNMMLSQMQAQSEQMKEQMEDLLLLKSNMKFEEETTRYFRDLYRFHKLFSKRAEFFDPFASAIDFINIPIVANVMMQDDIAAISEFYFKRGYYSEALPLLQSVAKADSGTPHIWEKIGFCFEKQPNGNKEAIESYMKAQLFNSESRWIAKRLGICYRRESDYRNAVEYIRMAMPADGSYDHKLTLLLSDILAQTEKWEESLNELYRVNYECPDDPEVLRRMSQCAFRMGDLEKSKSFLQSIPTINLSEEDYRLKGHIAFLRKNMEEALTFYKRTVRPNDEKRLWKSLILSDADILEGLGASRTDLILLLETLSYALE